MTLPVTADTCPLCQAVHGQVEKSWECPRHHHLIQFDGMKGDLERFACPVQGCHYERTAPKQPRPKKEPAMTVHHPIPAAPSTELAIRDSQDFWDPKQRAALAQLGIHDAPNADLAVFFHYCKAHRLDPFSHQATMIKRRDRQGDKWTIQTEIDGYRVIAHRAANRAGKVISYRPTIWIDSDEGEHRRWVRPEPPAAAEVTILVDGAPFTGYASYREFVPLHPQTGKPMGLWEKMPANQTAKCAEAQALRKAFPRDLGGTEIAEETAGQQAAPAAAPATWLPAPGDLDGVHDAEIVDSPEPEVRAEPRATSGQQNIIDSLRRGMGFEDHERDEWLACLAKLAQVPELSDVGDLTQDLAAKVIERLKACKGSRPALMDLITTGDAPDA